MDNSIILEIICDFVATLFTLATFVVYKIVPEVNNLQGSLLRRYLATQLCSYVSWFLSRCISQFEIINIYDVHTYGKHVHVFAVSVVIFLTFRMASTFWLNVMSLHIWRKSRTSPRLDPDNQKIDDSVKLFRYSVYVWVSAIVYSIFDTLTIFNLDWFGFHVWEVDLAKSIIVALIISGVGISNTCFYISTATLIDKRKRETSHLVDEVNRLHKEDEQWFNVYMKICIVIMVHSILWAIGNFITDSMLNEFIFGIEALNTGLVFLICVLKEDVRRSLRKQFIESIHKLISILRHRSKQPIKENGTSTNDLHSETHVTLIYYKKI